MASVSVSDRNSIAVELLRQGLYNQAQFVLREALSVLASTLSEEERTTIMPLSHNPITTISIDAACGKESTDDTTFAMYKKAFLIGSEGASEIVVSLVIFYNLAVTSHAMGLISGRSSFFYRALELYRKVYTMLSDHNQDLPTVHLLLLATCNNMGHLYALLLNTQGMESCHQQLQNILATNQAAARTTVSAVIDPSDLDFFFMAIVLGSNQQGPLPMAPAA